MNNYVLVSGDDWCGLYLNEKLIYENHSIEESRIFSIIIENGKTVDSFDQMYCDCEWLDALGRLPDKLYNVMFEVTIENENSKAKN